MKLLKKIILPFALLMLFVVYQTNITMNIHTHYVNGIFLTHSHPNNGAHTHTNAEIFLLDRLSVFHSLKVELSSYQYLQTVVWVIRVEQDIPRITNLHPNSFCLRAPPALA